MKISVSFIYVLLAVLAISGQELSRSSLSDTSKGDQGYLIDQPGTITFTVGVKIRGKVEKPQVMIFLPKESSWYKEVEFQRSFRQNLSEPLPFLPKTE